METKAWINSKTDQSNPLSHDRVIGREWEREGRRAWASTHELTQRHTTLYAQFVFNWNILLPLGEYIFPDIFVTYFLSSFSSLSWCVDMGNYGFTRVFSFSACNDLNLGHTILGLRRQPLINTCSRTFWYFFSTQNQPNQKDPASYSFFLTFSLSCLILVWFWSFSMFLLLFSVLKMLCFDFHLRGFSFWHRWEFNFHSSCLLKTF